MLYIAQTEERPNYRLPQLLQQLHRRLSSKQQQQVNGRSRFPFEAINGFENKVQGSTDARDSLRVETKFYGKFYVFVVTLGGRRGWGCIPQVLGRAALLETKCDRNVAVALENKSFRGRKRWEVVPDRNNKAGNNRAS